RNFTKEVAGRESGKDRFPAIDQGARAQFAFENTIHGVAVFTFGNDGSELFDAKDLEGLKQQSEMFIAQLGKDFNTSQRSGRNPFGGRAGPSGRNRRGDL